ncbi:MAG: hypothetical protein Q8S21_06240 [Candidatus Paracaedibacteraceae bacterium]|nr:hypothetical protein [Candidatus Paracaedibacteraceae bacterium]
MCILLIGMMKVNNVFCAQVESTPLNESITRYSTDNQSREKDRVNVGTNAENLKSDGLKRLSTIRARVNEINVELKGNPHPNEVSSLVDEKQNLEKEAHKITKNQVNQKYISYEMNEMQIQSGYLSEKVARVFRKSE